MICGMRFPQVNGPHTFLDLPSADGTRTRAEQAFNSACQAISEEWETAAAKRTGEELIQWLQGVAYQLLGHIFDHGLDFLIDERLRGFNRYSRGNEALANCFQRGLLAVFAHETRYRGPNAAQRSKMGRRLLHAYRHYVPHEFLRGFLSQVGDDQLKAKIESGLIEPGFEEWVVLKRLTDERPDFRGPYPSEIEELVATMRRLHPIISEVEDRKRIARKSRNSS